MDFEEFKAKLKVKLAVFVKNAKVHSAKAATAAMRSRVLALIGLLVTLAIGLGTADWLAATSGIVIMSMAAMLHSYRKREGF